MATRGRIEPSLNRLSTESTGVLQRDPGAFGQGVSSVGKSVSDFGDMLAQANYVAEKTKAENQMNARLTDIEQRAAQDSDTSPERRQQYEDEIAAAASEAAQHLTRPQDRSFFELEAEGKTNIARAGLNAAYMKKAIESGKAELDIYLQDKKNDFIKATSPAQKQMVEVDRLNKIDEMVSAGFLTEAQGRTLEDSQRREWAKAQVEYDIRTDPEMAAELLEGSAYPDIDEEDRVVFLDYAKTELARQQKIQNAQAQIERQQVTEDLGWKLFDGSLTLGDIEESRDFLTPEKATAFRDALLKPKSPDAVTANLSFAHFQDRFNKLGIVEQEKGGVTTEKTGASFEEVAKYREDVLRAVSKGLLTREDGTRLFRQSQGAFDYVVGESADALVKQKNPAWRNFTNSLTFWADENASNREAMIAEIHREFIDRVSAGEDPTTVVADIKDAQKNKLHPERKNYAKDDLIQAPVGSFKVSGEYQDGEPGVDFNGG